MPRLPCRRKCEASLSRTEGEAAEKWLALVLARRLGLWLRFPPARRLLLYRLRRGAAGCFPGCYPARACFLAGKDEAAWSILIDPVEAFEELEAAARLEFAEEWGGAGGRAGAAREFLGVMSGKLGWWLMGFPRCGVCGRSGGVEPVQR